MRFKIENRESKIENRKSKIENQKPKMIDSTYQPDSYFRRDNSIVRCFYAAIDYFGIIKSEDEVLFRRIVEQMPVTSDPISLSSSFLCYIYQQQNVTHPDSSRARSWQTWGNEVIDQPQEGDVVVLSRGRNETIGHVGLYLHSANGVITILGVNQESVVNFMSYPIDRVVSIRTLYFPA